MPSTSALTHRFVPAAAPGPRERVMVVLHGLGDSLNGFLFLPGMLRLPDVSCLLVNAPDPYYGGYSWYDYAGDPEPGVLRSRDLLKTLLTELKDQGVAPADTFLFGFSQGCLMAVDAGLHAAEPLGGIVGVSGYVAFSDRYPEEFGPAARAQKFLITHGRRDPMVAFEPARAQFEALRGLGVDLEFRAYDKVHTILPKELDDIAAWLRGRGER